MKPKLIVLLVAAVAVIGGAAVLLTGDSDKKQNNNSSQNTSNSDTSETPTPKRSGLALPAQTVGQQPDCSLYTLEDIAKIWGVPMTDTDVDGTKVSQINGPQNYQYECDYNQTDSGSGLSVILNFKVYESEDAAKTSIKNTRDGAKFGETVYFTNDEVSGIGDEAFFSTSTSTTLSGRQEQLYARKGNVVMLITGVDLAGKNATYRDKILQTYRLKLN